MFHHKLVVIALLVFGFALRIAVLDVLPHGFQNDEASFFYNAVALLETGADEDGRHSSLYLNSFIDPKPALFAYFQVPFIAVFGKTILAARLPSAILGTASLLLMYLLFQKLSRDRKLSVLVLFFATISPWHIILSRSTQEVILSFFMTMLMLLFATSLLLYKHSKVKNCILAILLLFASCVSMYAYHSAKLIAPIFSLSLLVYALAIKKFTYTSKLFRVFLLLLVLQLSFVAVLTFGVSGGLSRASAVSIFTTGDSQLVLDEQIRIATGVLPEPLIRVFHNKVINYGLAFLQTYFRHFTAQFLFLSGGDPTRYLVPHHGLLYLVELPLVLLGMLGTLALERKKKFLSLLFLSWLLISPISSAVTTQESVSMIRTALMIVPLLYFVSKGTIFVWNFAKNSLISKTIRGSLIISFLACFLYFIQQYAVYQPRYRPWTRQYIDQQLAKYLVEHQAKYAEVVIGKVTGEAYVYLGLEDLFPIKTLQQSFPARTQDEFALGKFTFVSDACFVGSEKNTLYVIGGTCKINSIVPYSVVETIRYFDGAEGYILVSVEREI